MPRVDIDSTWDGKKLTQRERLVSDNEIRQEVLDAQLRAGPLANLTADQADTWIDTNVLTLAQVRTAFKIVVRVLLALRDRA